MARVRKKKIISDKEMLTALINWRNENGDWPTPREINASPEMQSATQYAHRFADMESAYVAARYHAGEFTASELQHMKQWAPRVLQQLDIISRQLKPGKRITVHLLTKTPGAPSIRDIARYCGGLNSALRQLNLPVSDPTREELIIAIQKLAQDIGRTPRLEDIDVENCGYSRAVFMAEFVYWNDLLVEAGLDPYMDQSKKRKPPKCVCSKSARANAGCSDG